MGIFDFNPLGIGESSGGSGKKQHAFKYLDQGMAQSRGFMGQQDMLLQQALRYAKEGYGGAISQIGRGESSARTGAIDRGAKLASGYQSQAVERGLYNTSAAIGQQRGVGADTTRALSDITARFSGMKGNLMARQGQALAGIQGARSNLFNPMIQGAFGIGRQKADYRLQTRGVGTSGVDWQGIAQMAGMGMGMI